MIEIVFNDSVKVAIKMAKNYDKDKMMGSAIGHIGSAKSKEIVEKEYEGEPIGGSPKDVICLGFNLDMGDISGEITDDKRKALYFDINHNYFNDYDSEIKELENEWQKKINEFNRFIACAENKESFRIWWSDAPNETCGFYFVNFILQKYNCNISSVKLPRFKVSSNKKILMEYSGWSEIEPGKFYEFLPSETKIEKIFNQAIANKWRELKIQNSPLRAIVNGKLMGVQNEFYDQIIYLYIPKIEFKLARLVGIIIGNNPIGVSDWWYVQRINKMIENKELEIISDNEFIYEKILKKV